jgi:hypothetical protein
MAFIIATSGMCHMIAHLPSQRDGPAAHFLPPRPANQRSACWLAHDTKRLRLSGESAKNSIARRSSPLRISEMRASAVSTIFRAFPSLKTIRRPSRRKAGTLPVAVNRR